MPFGLVYGACAVFFFASVAPHLTYENPKPLSMPFGKPCQLRNFPASECTG